MRGVKNIYRLSWLLEAKAFTAEKAEEADNSKSQNYGTITLRS